MPKEILLYNDIYSYSAADVVSQMGLAGNADCTLRVCSDGGELKYGWAILSKFQELKGNKKLINDGEANSMAANLFFYNKNNVATDVASFGLHRASYGDWEMNGNCSALEIEDLIDKNKKLRAAMEASIDVAKFTELKGVTLDQFFSLDGQIDVIVSAQEALEIRMIQEIVALTPELSTEIEARKTVINAKFKPHKIAAKAEPVIPTTMTVEEIKNKFPDAYKAIFAKGKEKGIQQEFNRVDSILAFAESNPKECVKAFKTKAPLLDSQRTDFLRAEFAAGSAAIIEGEGHGAIKVPATATSETEKAAVLAKFKGDVFAKLNIKTAS